MCGSNIKFPTLPGKVTSRRKTHWVRVGTKRRKFYIRMGSGKGGRGKERTMEKNTHTKSVYFVPLLSLRKNRSIQHRTTALV